ncbi:MAG: hypothetical protein MJ105_06710 [Lachnospiraceae bacterium]|nr:hypothetical protein [Lachnospiraceae bacterium]
MEPTLEIKEFPNEVFKCTYSIGETLVCKCMINLDTKEDWQVTGWYTNEEYKNQGIGKLTMQKLLSHLYAKFGKPQNILYIWNGVNRYVYDWIKANFDAYCRCPISVQKYQSEDDWDSHMYILDVDKLFAYFGIQI